MSDTTLRARRDEWIAAGVFEQLRSEALAAFDRIVGLDLSEVALDGSLHKAPYGGEGTGPNPTDRANAAGSGPSPWTVTASRSAGRSTAPTATTSACSNPPSMTSPPPGCSSTSTRMHLDRGYDYGAVRQRLAGYGLTDVNIQRRGTKEPGKKQPVRLGLRWIVEATNTWWSNYGQLRRNTDRRNRHRHAALCLATVILIVGKLITWRDRWASK